MLANIYLALSNLKMVHNHRRRAISLIPNVLFSRYTKFLSLLSSNALTLSFILVTTFFYTLPLELQEVVRLGSYILSDLSRSSTSLLLEQALQNLREYVVISFKLLTEDNCRIRRIVIYFNNIRGSSQNLLVDSNHTSSNADQNIQCVDSHHSSSNTE